MGQAKQGIGCVGGFGLLGLLVLGLCGYQFSKVREETERRAAAPPAVTRPAAPKMADLIERDIAFKAACVKGGFGTVAMWNLRLTNNSKTTTYKNFSYRTMYDSDSGVRLKTNRGQLLFVLRPGETKTLAEFKDGFIPQQVTRCGMVLYNAQVGP